MKCNYLRLLQWEHFHLLFLSPPRGADPTSRFDFGKRIEMNPLEKPLVSIILPSFNRKNIVDRAITSVIKQTYPHWELHIVDDGSTDETWKDLLSKLTNWKGNLSSFGRNQKSIQVHQIEHRGVSGARNFGIQKANAEWIAFLDSDDEWYPEKLSKQMDFHKSNPEFFFSQTKEVWNKKEI